MEAVVDDETFAAGFPFAGRHRLVGDEEVVQAAGTGKADLVARIEHARRIAQQAPRVVERDRLQERLRRQAGPAAEQVVQVCHRNADRVCDGFDFGLRAPLLRDEGDRIADDRVIFALRDEGQVFGDTIW
jgi:hypothetical protein